MKLRTIVAHWRLALLAVTSVALSIASGWTTWDGMSHFTHEPVLSLLITFGVQSIMLVTAWLIGETFANRYRPRVNHGKRSRLAQVVAVLLTIFAVVLVMAAFGWLGEPRWLAPLPATAKTWQVVLSSWPTVLVATGAIAVALLVAGQTFTAPFVGALRVVAQNGLLWFMFMACMLASVFFSFDSLFSVLFSPEDRARVSITRAMSASDRIAGRVRAAAERERAEQRTAVLGSGSYRAYTGGLDALAGLVAASEASRAKNRQSAAEGRDQIRARNTQRIAELTVQLQQGSARREAVARSVTNRRKAVTDLQKHVTALTDEIAAKQSDLALKRSELRAEELGLASSAMAGRGTRYRGIAREIGTIEVAVRALDEQAALAAARLATAQASLSAAETSFASAAGAEARLKSEMALMERQSATTADPADIAEQEIGPRAAVMQLAEARLDFERMTTREALQALQARCTGAVGLLIGSGEAMSPRIDCNPLRVHEAATQLFGLDVAAAGRAAQCGGGGSAVVEEALGQARACLNASGLPEGRAAELRHEIDSLERNRDDKAHRFVVTWNALEDLNPLALLALALALGIDALVFVAGLLGATAVRSQFASLPRSGGHSVNAGVILHRRAGAIVHQS